GGGAGGGGGGGDGDVEGGGAGAHRGADDRLRPQRVGPLALRAPGRPGSLDAAASAGPGDLAASRLPAALNDMACESHQTMSVVDAVAQFHAAFRLPMRQPASPGIA